MVLKKIIAFAFAAAFAAAPAAAAAETETGNVAPQDIVFSPVGGGKFLYNNNPEGIDDAAVAAGEDPRYVSNHDGLTPDTYYLYMSYFNYTGSGSRGYDIEVDVQITAREDAVFYVDNASFETVQITAYTENWTLYRKMPEWQFNSVCADMLGIPVTAVDGSFEYAPHTFKGREVHLKKGETFWLSDCFDEDYDVVHFADPVHFQALIELESGVVDMDTIALPHNGTLGDRSEVPQDIAFGIYRYDYTIKGIADTLPQVKTDTLRYTIDDSNESGTILPGTVYNQYSPDGLTVDSWCSNIDPVADHWSKEIAVESDMLAFEYEDDNKLTYYGENVKEKDNIWRFDTRHAAVTSYTELSDKEPDEYSPNFEITDIYREGIEPAACNLGNYGVTETYDLEITNAGSKDRYFEYSIMTKSDVIVYTADADGNAERAYSKGITDDAVMTPMASVLLPAGETVRFSVNMLLPVNVNGGIRSMFRIRDTYTFQTKPQRVYDYTSPIRGRNLIEVKDKLGESALEEFSSNLDSYEINIGKDMSIVRWSAWDGAHWFYSNVWGYCDKIYVLDENYEIESEYKMPHLATETDISGDTLYARDIIDGVYMSEDRGRTWKRAGISTIPANTSFYGNIGDIETVTLYTPDGNAVDHDVDTSDIEGYISQLEMKPNINGSLDDRVYSAMVINDKYYVGDGIALLGVKYITDDDDKWLKNELSNRIFKHETASAWADAYLDSAFERGIVPLYMKADTKPFTAPLTRLEFCDLIYEMLERLGNVPGPSDAAFYDCADKRVMSLVTAGIINGVSPTEFMPDGNITREQAAAVLARTADYMGAELDGSEVEIADTVSEWARGSVYMMYNAGVMNGVGDGRFDACGSYTKEQSITAQLRLYEYLTK